MRIAPMTVKAACSEVARIHRKHNPPQGGLFAAALKQGDTVIGVAIAGRPVSRHLDDGWTIEVTRVAVMEATPNGCSMLYGAILRAAKALGYSRAITYTCGEESGRSCRAAGFTDDGEAGGGVWHAEQQPLFGGGYGQLPDRQKAPMDQGAVT